MLYSVVMVERLNENLQFFRDINFYQGSLSSFFLMNKHKKDDRFREVIAPNGEVIRREVLMGVTHWLDLSQLTTKKAALELAEKAFEAGCYSTEENSRATDGGGWENCDIHVNQKGIKADKENFISQNKELL